jgi:hypothetical protein
MLDSQGPVLEHYQEQGTTVNSTHSSVMATHMLESATQTKCQGLLLKVGVLLHGSVCPCIAAHTAETLLKLKFDNNGTTCM